jgi:hypothetical protein
VVEGDTEVVEEELVMEGGTEVVEEELVMIEGGGEDTVAPVDPAEFRVDLELSKADMDLLKSVQQHYRIPGVASGVVHVANPPSYDDDEINEELPRPKTASGRDAAWSSIEVQTTLLERALVAATATGTAGTTAAASADVWRAPDARRRSPASLPKPP